MDAKGESGVFMTKGVYVLAVAAAVLAAGCARRENVVLVVVDTLRADRLGCYGHDRPTSPFIDSLARQGVVFDQAYATAPWTVPSVASLMTSLPPRLHGCRHGIIQKETRGLADQEVLADDFETLAERLQSLGYRTYGVSANPHVSREMGFGQGFDAFETLWLADAPALNGVVEMWADALRKRSRRPWFLYVHYLDPHAPYHGREPWITAFAAGTTNHVPFDGATPDERDAVLTAAGRGIGDTEALQTYVDATRSGFLNLYDSEIAYTDSHLRALFERLGIDARRTTVIVTADHGEEFLEHDGIVGHGRSLYEPSVRVPLIWCGPQVGAPGARIRTPVSLTDIFPTLAALNRSAAPPNSGGVSLAAALATGAEPEPRSLVMETERFPADVWVGMRDEEWKYLVKAGRGGPARKELYQIARDPGERDNLVPRHGDMAGRFDDSLRAWAAQRPLHQAQRASVWLDAKREQELRSLGYLK